MLTWRNTWGWCYLAVNRRGPTTSAFSRCTEATMSGLEPYMKVLEVAAEFGRKPWTPVHATATHASTVDNSRCAIQNCLMAAR
jgi:hypothetical protein